MENPFKKRPAVPTRVTGPADLFPDRLPPRPAPMPAPTGTSPIVGAFGPGQRLRDLRRENGATDDDVQPRGRGYSGGGSGWGGIN